MALGDQPVIGLGDLLLGEAGSEIIDQIERIEHALHFLVGASSDDECAHPGLHGLIQHVHCDVRELRRGLVRGVGVADLDPRDP